MFLGISISISKLSNKLLNKYSKMLEGLVLFNGSIFFNAILRGWNCKVEIKDSDRLDWSVLSSNPEAIALLSTLMSEEEKRLKEMKTKK